MIVPATPPSRRPQARATAIGAGIALHQPRMRGTGLGASGSHTQSGQLVPALSFCGPAHGSIVRAPP